MAVDADALVVDEPGHEGCTPHPDGRKEDGAPVTVTLKHTAGALDRPLQHLFLHHVAEVQWRWVRHFDKALCVVLCMWCVD